MKLAHGVNLYAADPGTAQMVQQVTLASMRQAREATTSAETEVSQWAITTEADAGLAPADFGRLPHLKRTVLDVGRFDPPRLLPLLRDILDALYLATTADYLIYTNADIGLQPHFYTAVANLIDQGFDSFVINRRTLSGQYSSPDQLPDMLAEPGKSHPGWDCFVFPRALYPQFKLGTVCLGAGRVGLALLANMAAYSHHFKLFAELQLTFHIGDDRAWRDPAFVAYDAHNTRELMSVLADIEAERGPFAPNSIVGRFLWKKRTFGPLYDWWSRR